MLHAYLRDLRVRYSFLPLLALLLPSALASPISVSLKTPWPAPDLLLQAAEHLPPDSFFSLLDSTTPDTTPQETYDSILTHFSQNPVARDLLKLDLSLHTTAPAVQALYHYYQNSVLPETAASDPSFDPTCDVWINWYGTQACTLDRFNQMLETPSPAKTPHIFSFDHVKPFAPRRDKNRLIAILYADISSPRFQPFHSHLSKLADTTNITYVLRYRPPSSPRKTLFLNGYGVELALKSTEYKVIDERDEPSSKESFASSPATEENAQLSFLIENENIDHAIKPLLAEQISDLGIKATQYILQSEDPISALVRLAQDFPKHAHTIAQLNVNETIRFDITRMQGNEGVNALWINGMAIDPKDVQPFALLRILQSEYKLVSSLKNLGLSASESINLLTLPSLADTDSSDDPNGVLRDMVDVRDKSEGKRVVLWFNDLEKDMRYADWPDTIEEILRPSYPGQLKYLRKNLFSVLFLVDLSNLQGVKFIVEDVAMLVKRKVPIRFGMVPMVDDRLDGVATKIANVIGYISKQLGRASTMQFLAELLKLHGSAASASSEVTVSIEDIRHAFQSTVSNKVTKNAKFEFLDFETIAGGNRKDMEVATGAHEFMARVGVEKGHRNAFFINGRYFDLDDDYTRIMVQTVQKQLEYLQLQVYNGKISDKTDIYGHFLSRKEVYPMRRPRVFPSDARPLRFISPDALESGRNHAMESIYFGSAADVSTAPITVWVVADLNSEYGSKTAKAALEYAQTPTKARVAIIHVPSFENDGSGNNEDKAAKIYRILASSASRKGKMEQFLNKLDRSQSHEDGEEFATPEEASALQMQMADFASSIGGGWERRTNVIINGRILGPFDTTEVFDLDDFKTLEEFEWNQRIFPMETALKVIKPWESLRDEDSISYADYLMGACSAAGAANVAKDPEDIFASKDTVRRRPYQALDGLTHIRVGTDQNAMFEIATIIDPLSDVAQKWTAILKTLSNLSGVQLDVYLNPHINLSELPLKRFYRYVMDSELRFDETGEIIRSGAHFTNLPTEPLLTLGIDAISPWVVSPVESVHDLDNIRLSSLDSKYNRTGVEAVYMLENILVEGHAQDKTTQGPPRGLQFVLESHTSSASRSHLSSKNRVDTIVMANLGYLQLKANPGIWELFLREGRSSAVFDLESAGFHGLNSGQMEESGTVVALRSFEGVVLYPKVRRKPGMEKEDVLSEVDEVGASWWERMQSKFALSGNQNTSEPKKAQINVFSVASGHLYERFMSIMILSVLKTTKSSVKFWLIENFLSPSFKKFIPYMAAEYNFEYEFITYRWPHWLRPQTEKQRTIWGYKILFLDVLFPLDLDKVIFVDADQVVRADLQELVDFDLKGAPYGYTPFCNTRSGMERFRFWEQGYWKSHLQGKPYHISALYVIDLRHFRQVAAGDRLRGQYQGLSADPQSLANLDQDLPNNMQHQVPIRSLPIEWLWCETWCDDKSLKRAKTIDLCNNPLTKEPKLERAKRLLPEWEALDNEVNALRRKVESSDKDMEKKEKETTNGKEEAHDEL